MIPKIVHIYWHDLKTMDKFTLECVDRLKNLNKDMEIRLYDHSLFEKITQGITFKWEVKHAHKSDLVRLYLIKKYGGVYMDASIYCNKPLTDIVDFNSNKIQMYESVILINNIENSFIASPSQDVLIKKWFKESMHALKIGHYEYLKKNHRYIQQPLISYLPYLIAMVQFYKVFHKNMNRVKYISMASSPRHFLYYQIKNNWNTKKAILFFLKNKDRLVISKVRCCDRACMKKYVKAYRDEDPDCSYLYAD